MTSGTKILGVTGGIVAVLIVGKIGLGFLHQPDDKTLILDAIKEAQRAGREGRPGGVLDFLSYNDFKVNDTDATGARKDIADRIKNLKPDIQFNTLEPVITGENARIESSATVNIAVGPFKKDVPISNVVINLKKEIDREWFIIPKKTWKITEIRASLDDLSSFSMGG